MNTTPRSNMSQKKRTLKASALLMMFVVSVVLSSLLGSAKPALAQFPVTDASVVGQMTKNSIAHQIEYALVESAVVAVVNSANYFTEQLAYQAAKALTSDCPGQVVCWDSKGFSDGFRQAWQGAIGEGIGSLSQGLLGNNLLCSPPGLNLILQLGLMKETVPGRPKCDFNQLVANWDSIYTSFETGQILDKLKPQFKLGQSPLSVSIASLGIKREIISNAQRDEVVNRLIDAASGGFSPVRDQTSGRIKSPGAVTKAEFDKGWDAEKGKMNNTRSVIAGSIAKGAVKSIALTAVNTFVSTLTARLWNKLVNGLMSTGQLLSVQPDIIFSAEGILQPPGATAAAEIQQSKIVPITTREAGEYDPLIHFTSCPPSNPAPNNCVMDQQFADLVRIGDGTPLTIREALKKGLLHSDWRLFPATEKQRDTDPFCYTYAYCESNLKQLRAARIISIGWEIAASKVSSTPVTLGEVVAHFHDCNANDTIDAAHPWCHLIDPDWVIKVPPMQCRASVYGPTLLSSESSTRAEVCVDSPTCLKQDDFGKCVGGWGYCQKERNVWRFQGDQCPAYYNSCRTLKTRAGGTENFLINTVNVDVCNADNVGCLAYSLQATIVSAQKKKFCGKAAVNAGAQCILNSDCSGDTCASSCPLDKGCLAGNAGGNDGCAVANGGIQCKVDDGTICTLEAKCANAGGCMCYLSTCRVAKGQDSCTSTSGDEQYLGDDWRVQPQRYFNKNVQSCSAEDNGCSALVPLATGQSLNLIRNGGFEEQEDGDGDGTPDHAKFWAPFGKVPAGGAGALDSTAANVKSGSNAMTLGTAVMGKFCSLATKCTNDAGCTCTDGDYTCKVVKDQTKCLVTNQVVQDAIPIKGNTTYTLSASFLKRGAANGKIMMSFVDLDGKPTALPLKTVVSTTTYQDKDGNPVTPTTDDCASNGSDLVFNFATTADQVRASCTLIVDDSKLAKKIVHAWLEITGDGTVDEVQFEQGSLTPFHEGYGSANTVATVKIPPAYLGCTGDENDRPECASFAGVCREQEVGCDRYTPTDGDPSIPAVTGPQDACPKECAGYDIFKQEATTFDTEKFPVYFIPTTAKQCSQAESGCSEFTNVENEQLAYFSRLRLCQKPSTDPKTVFYTWEGSDTAGYQLKVWNLKKITDAAGGPSFVAGDVGVKASDLCADSAAACANAGVAPCTRLDDKAINCASVDDALPAGSTDGLCSRDAIDKGDLDCREFYDADGNRHFRKLSKTIILTAECHQYRITDTTAADCAKSNGQWLADKGQCIYNADIAESQSCGKAFNGCRPYKGNASSNVRSIVNDTFEDGLNGWDKSDVSQSSESVIVGGHSLKFKPGMASTVKEVGGMVADGRSYTLTFWARGSGTLAAGFEDGKADITCDNKKVCDQKTGCACVTPTGLACVVEEMKSTCDVLAKTTTAPTAPLSLSFSDNVDATSAPKITLTPDWKQYSLGPVSAVDSTWGTIPTNFVFTKDGIGEAFLDNVILKEVPESIYVVRDSWNTPVSCDRTSAGVPSPQEMLGCKEYTNSANTKSYLRSFAQLCRDKAVGCKAYSYTQNNLNTPYEESYNAVCQLVDKRVTPEARTCGKCTLPGGAVGPAVCNDGINTCTVGAGARDCNVASDEASNCKCDYNIRHPWYSDDVPDLPDICRVAIGESACHFKLDGWDDNTPQATHPDRVNIPADQQHFLVATADNVCAPTAVGCKNVGNPQISYERECTLPNTGVGIKAGKCDDATGCVCGPVFNATCTVAKGLSTCTLSFENGIPGKWNAMSLKDDPAEYGQTLCTQPAVSCEEFTANDGKYYFKEPFDRTCQYKEGVSVGGQPAYGWFRKSAAGKDIPCYPELLQNGDYFNLYKNADALCKLPDGLTCTDKTPGWDALSKSCKCTQPPSPDQVCRVAEGNTTCGYQGWVGQCTPEYDRCEEFLDPATSSPANPKGQPYYYIMNDKLDLTSCGGSASLKESCILLTKTSNPARLFGSAATYFLSEKTSNGGRVSPLNCNLDPRNPYCDGRCYSADGGYTTACTKDEECNKNQEETCAFEQIAKVSVAARQFTQNDANIVVKVRPDRECAEWLACSATSAVWDQAQGRYKFNCAGFDACTKQRKVGSSEECGGWLARPAMETKEDIKKVKRITADSYANRDIRFRGVEYSGFSIVGEYPAQYATVIDYRMGVCVNKSTGTAVGKLCWADGDCGVKEQRCGKRFSGFCASTKLSDGKPAPCNSLSDCGVNDVCDASQSAIQRVGVALGANVSQCKTDADCAVDAGCSGAYDCPLGSEGRGRCIASMCVYDMRGGSLRSDPINAPSCRGYPEDDAPFPSSVVQDNGYEPKSGLAKNIKPGFSHANICVDGNICECSYTRVGFGAGGSAQRYVSQSNRRDFGFNAGADGVCVNGPNDGWPCDPNDRVKDTCVREEGGVCSRRTKEVRASGWYGYCLDPDYRRNINANQERFGCNLWLPLDQLAGSADLSNQFEDAGYVNADNLLYCQAAKGTKRGGGLYPYAFTILDQMAVVASGERGVAGDRVDGWWANPGSVNESNIDQVLDSDIAEVRAKDISYPFDLDPNKNPPVYKDEVAGIHIAVNAGFSKWDLNGKGSHGASNLDVFLTEQNGWTFAWKYSEGTDHSVPEAGFKIQSNVEAKDVDNTCQWGFSHDDIGGAINTTDNVLCVKAEWDNKTGKLVRFRTTSHNDDDRCNGLDTKVCVAAALLSPACVVPPPNPVCVAVTARCALPAIAQGIQDGCPNFLAKVEVDYREWCQEIAQTHKIDGSERDYKNYAWTDKLFKGGGNSPYDFVHKTQRFLSGGGFPTEKNNPLSKEWDLKPFGAIPQKAGFDEKGNIIFDVNSIYSPQKEYDKTSPLQNFILPVYDSEGGSVFTHIGNVMSDDPTKKPLLAFNFGSTVSGTPFACFGDCGGPGSPPNVNRNVGSKAGAYGAQALSQYFAVGFTTYEWPKGRLGSVTRDAQINETEDKKYVAYTPDVTMLKSLDTTAENYKLNAKDLVGTGWDFRQRYATEFNAPKILSVNFGRCFSSRTCEEGPAGLTINKLSSGNQVGQGGKFKAVLSYYAYADKEHMPLRHKIVDWGDDHGIIDLWGWYKNHRGSRVGGNGQAVSLCDQVAEGFGGTPQACQNEFFQETKTYTCSVEQAGPTGSFPDCVAANPIYPCKRGGQCVYQPKVQFTDNWETCNGKCLGAPGVGNLCMGDDECKIPPYPDGKSPWTAYNGEILVTPATP